MSLINVQPSNLSGILNKIPPPIKYTIYRGGFNRVGWAGWTGIKINKKTRSYDPVF
jgi:hypothetical protein